MSENTFYGGTDDSIDPAYKEARSAWRSKRKKLSHEPAERDSAFGDRDDPSDRPRKRRHHHRHHSRREKSTTEPRPESRNPFAHDEGIPDPDAAFRESLFDAMADDEGAAFWEGVYGQPIHVYPDAKDGPDGATEKMTDEEYVAWVRHQMWEKTHEGILEAHRQREERARRSQKTRQETKRMEAERQSFQRQMEESLKRAEARKQNKKWQESWTAYEKSWERVNNQIAQRSSNGGADAHVGSVEIPWPVMSGQMTDVNKAAIEAFLKRGPPRGKDGEVDLKAVLKVERVRFHPDKVQHRFGGQALGEDRLRKVTAVFQIVDSMWSDLKTTTKI